MAMILVIDDDDVREMLSAALENFGYAVIVAPNGDVGLQKFIDERPDLVLTDIIMPESDGIEIIRNPLDIPGARIAAISGGGERVNAAYCVDTAS